MPPISVDPSRFRDQPLHLAPCIIAREASDGDYVVICDDLIVARIRRAQKSFGRVAWDWTFTGPHFPSSMAKGSGSADTLSDAKAVVRKGFDLWLDYFSASPEQAVWLV
jgi:hypothetical protein